MKLSIYSNVVIVNPMTELGNSNTHTRRTNAINLIVGVFFCPSINGSRARDTERCADVLVSRFSNSRTAAALILGKINGSSKLKPGAISMPTNDTSRLCAENRAVLEKLNTHLDAAELVALNAALRGMGQYCLEHRANPNLNQALYALAIRFNRVGGK